MVVSPRPAHPFWIPMVWDDVVVVRELVVADCAYAVLSGNFPLQKLSHFSGGPEFPIPSRVMGIFYMLHSKPDKPRFGNEFPTTAGDGFVDRAEFIATEPHGIPPDGTG